MTSTLSGNDIKRTSIRIFLFYILYSFHQISAFPRKTLESFTIRYLEDGRITPVRVEIDADKQLEYVKSAAGETLYDFNQGKVGYKDFSSSQCFMANIREESLDGDLRSLKNLQNGVIRGFYTPTFVIKEELDNSANLTDIFGIFLTKFCKGNSVSLVIKRAHRAKRNISPEKEQFTHHSYGHYGHQSNNYAHYGHETYMSGGVDKDGQIQNLRVNQQQIRSESSQAYPPPSQRNQQQDTASDSRMGFGTPQRQYQTQYKIPSYQQTSDDSLRNSAPVGSGQFALQSTHEGGYQLNLPLGLQAGNIYRGGIRSEGHYGVGRSQPYLSTDYQQLPHTVHSTFQQTPDQTGLRQPLPPVPRASYPSRHRSLSPEDPTTVREKTARTTFPSYHDFDQSQLTQRMPGIPDIGMGRSFGHTQPGIHTSVLSTKGDRYIPIPGTDSRTESRPFISRDQKQSRTDYESQYRKEVDQRIIPNGQLTSSTEDHPVSLTSPLRPITGDVPQRTEISSIQPGISMPSINIPRRIIQSPFSSSEHISTKTSGIETTHPQLTRVSGHSHEPSSHPDSIHRNELMPGRLVPSQQHLKTPGTQYPAQYGTSGQSQTPFLHTPGIYPGYPSSINISGTDSAKYLPERPSSQVLDTSQMTVQGLDKSVRNGIQYPTVSHPRTGRVDFSMTDTYPGAPGVPEDSRRILSSGIRPGTRQILPTGTGPIPPDSIRDQVPTAYRPGERIPATQYDSRTPLRGIPESSQLDDQRIISGSARQDTSKIFGQDSASSQTQIQTGLEETAAEATAAGQYRGLVSQTQVQGGYSGNGSFSAQAQSGFTGGVVQSQVQGNKQGGLSGSSAQVERVGSAQSQVQVGQPSGSASSTAQGRFTGGTTQVQAQSSKTGGSAGAQAQSTGLSSSHVQVNVDGNNARKEERFRGTVSASVLGGHMSGQSQTQLQGGYNSGRTYAATAQGGFDSSAAYQGFVPPESALISVPDKTFQDQQPSDTISSQVLQERAERRQYPVSSSTAFGVPSELKTPGISSREQTITTDAYRYPQVAASDGRSFETGQQPQQILPHSRSLGSQQARRPEIPGQLSHPHTIMPGSQDSFSQIPGLKPSLQDLTYPQSPSHSLSGPSDKQYLGIYPQAIPQPPSHNIYSQYPYTSDSRYTPSYPAGLIPHLQQPSLSGHPIPRPSLQSGTQVSPHHFPDNSHIPVSQMIPSQRHELPVLMKPDGSHYTDFEPSLHQPSSVLHSTQFQPGHPQIPHQTPQVHPEKTLPQLRPQIYPEQTRMPPLRQQFQPGNPQTSQLRPQIQPEIPHISPARPQMQPDTPHSSSARPQVQPQMTHISPASPQIQRQIPQVTQTKQQILTTTEKTQIPVTISPSTTTKPERIPGVREPDVNNCCAALRDLKQRCCHAVNQSESSICCSRSSKQDIIDFSSEDDLDEMREPCKVVKAICYIVYKPVGKARICKPTATQGC